MSMTVGELKTHLSMYEDDVEVHILVEYRIGASITAIYPMRDFEDEGIHPDDVETRPYPTIVISAGRQT